MFTPDSQTCCSALSSGSLKEANTLDDIPDPKPLPPHMCLSANLFILYPLCHTPKYSPHHLPLGNKRAAACFTLPAVCRNFKTGKSGWLPLNISQLSLENLSQIHQCPTPPMSCSLVLSHHLCLLPLCDCVSQHASHTYKTCLLSTPRPSLHTCGCVSSMLAQRTMSEQPSPGT